MQQQQQFPAPPQAPSSPWLSRQKCTPRDFAADDSDDHLLAYVIFIRLVGVILKLCSPFIATPDCISLSNSTKAIPALPGTRRTSLKPGNCWKSILSIISFTWSGRFSTKRIGLGIATAGAEGGAFFSTGGAAASEGVVEAVAAAPASPSFC